MHATKIPIPARPKAPATHLYVKIIAENSARLADRPVIFILPGGPGIDHSAYKKYSRLKNVANIVFHDPRGCGLSDKGDPATYTMKNYIDDVDVIRRHLKLRKIIPVGKSYGSICALGYALHYPRSLTKLVLAAGAPSFRLFKSARRNLARRGTPAQIKAAEKIWRGNFKNNTELAHYLAVTASLYSNKAKTKTSAFNLTQSAARFSYEACNLGFKDFLRHFDYEPDLHKIACPTLILAGADDWINDVGQARLMAKKIPNNQLIVFENSSHSMEVDAPKEFFQAIRDFVRRRRKF